MHPQSATYIELAQLEVNGQGHKINVSYIWQIQ